MSFSENDDSRAAAVGRKRKTPGEFSAAMDRTAASSSSGSSREEGEISSGGDSSRRPSIKDFERDWEGSQARIRATIGQTPSRVSFSLSSAARPHKQPADSSQSQQSLDDMMADSANKKAATSTAASRNLEMKERTHDEGTDNDRAFCRCCGKNGHHRDQCPDRYCSHCGAFEQHGSMWCPTWRKCSHCHQRGHTTKDCRKPRFIGADACDWCGKYHEMADEDCMGIPYEQDVHLSKNPQDWNVKLPFEYGRKAEEPEKQEPAQEQRNYWQMGMFDDMRD